MDLMKLVTFYRQALKLLSVLITVELTSIFGLSHYDQWSKAFLSLWEKGWIFTYYARVVARKV